MKEKKKKNTDKESTVNKPLPDYSANRITFFSSFEEMNEYDAMESAKLTPVQHLQNVTRLIKALYTTELKKKFTDKRIHLKKIKI